MSKATDIFRACGDAEWRRRRALAARVGYAHLPRPSMRVPIAAARLESYARVRVRFGEHCRRVDDSLQPSVERIAA